MSDSLTMDRFSCDACARTFAWKPALAGKRVKCKCGEPITVPAEIAPREEGEYDLEGLADLDAKAAESATARDQRERMEQPRLAPIAELAAPRTAAAIPANLGPPLGYAPGMTQRQRERAIELNRALTDNTRDLIAPLCLLIGGFLMYVVSYAVAFKLGGAGIVALGFGVSVITAIKAFTLVVSAILIANPLGVSFGGLYSAVLKLAAIAVFADGCNACLIASFGKVTHGFGLGMTLPVSGLVYWTLLTYLFSMDVTDSRLVVTVLTIGDFLLRTAILILLANVLFGHGMASAMGTYSSAKTAAHKVSPRTTYVDQLHDFGLLREATAYVAAGHQAFVGDTVKQMYAAGAKNIWFEVTRDINGKGGPTGIYVEMPESPAARLNILTIRKAFYDANSMGSDPSLMKDDSSEQYIELRIR